MSTSAEETKQLFLEGKTIEHVLRRVVRHALLQHKRAGNTIAAWEGGRVVLIPAEQIHVEDEENVGHDAD
jgi:hypothetical protein